tara:strand:+ start:835 stop:1044 length:210 start_codon:yes stop_codon:yes gene_type:complete
MTLTESQREVLKDDIQIMSFNLGQCTLIDNILSMNWQNTDELLMFIKVWKTKMDKETDEINARYEGLKK